MTCAFNRCKQQAVASSCGWYYLESKELYHQFPKLLDTGTARRQHNYWYGSPRLYETWEYHNFFGNQSSIHHFHFCFRHNCFLAMSAQHGILQATFVNVSFCSLTRNHSFNLDFYPIHDYVFIEWAFTRLPSFGRTQLLQPDL